MRKPFQGILNIIRFNWHFYIFALWAILLLLIIAPYASLSLKPYLNSIAILIFCSTFASLIASFYIYDLSNLYALTWLPTNNHEALVVNIHAGFDETSHVLKNKFKYTNLVVLDFFDPVKHTEISIKRARKFYPAFPGTKTMETSTINLADNSVDTLCVLLSAHEIRDAEERHIFFQEINRVIKPTGEIYVMEHLRDIPNLIVYNIGCFHFYSRKSWLTTFENAGLHLKHEQKMTPFVSIFILDTHGNIL